jgi:hypothetical protein
MGQFKPMVKMMTDEPSVILKLKKGGKVASKAAGQSEGFKSMANNNAKVFEGAESGVAPKKPSMAERRRAMNPNMYAKGGKVAHKDMGGAMMARPGMVPGATAPSPMPMQAMGRAALMNMAPAQRMKRAGMVQRALSGMKDGGSAECKALEKELKHHESMSASKAHGKASGGIIMSKTGKTKMDTAKKGKTTGSTGEVKEGQPGGYKSGGGVKMGNAGGFKSGGKVPGLTGATIEGGDWENRPADTSKPGVKNTTTGGVKNGNGGGFKMGGRASKKAYATGGQVVDDGKAEKMPRHAISRPVANSLQSGTFAKGGKVDYYTDLAKRLQKNPEKPSLRLVKTHTGPKGHVAKVYKDRDYGEHRVKFFSPEGKHYPEGDYHTDDVGDAHDTAQGQLNRYKKGGMTKRYAEGDLVDASKGAYDAAGKPSKEDMDMAKTIRNIPSKLFEGAKTLMGVTPKPAGSVTKTEKSVTVSPASKKRGGSAMC